MIFDRIENHHRYNLGPHWEQAFSFLKTLDANSKPGRYDLVKGDKMYALVMTYPPLLKSEGKTEAHNKYIDIQCTLGGVEGMYVYDRNKLQVQHPYDISRDVEYYTHDYSHEHFLSVHAGEFAVFFNTDAHMPQMLATGSQGNITKVVVKVRKDLLLGNKK